MALLLFLILLVLLIIIHELGHFTAARAFGIPVEEFGIGFPPRLYGIKKGETLYSINALPFGGFVKILGESQTGESEIPEELRKNSFHRKPLWIQATVIIAGIACNLLAAWVVLSVGYAVGLPASASQHSPFGQVQNIHTTIAYVLPGSPAGSVGIQAGDQVLGAQTGSAKLTDISASSVQQFIASHQNESVVLTIERAGAQRSFLAKPADNIVPEHKAIGVELDDVGILQVPWYLALLQGAVLFWQMTVATAEGLGHFFLSIVTGTANFSQVAGPIGIAGLGAQAVQQGFATTVTLIALISINLALINIIPIPGLDGGRLLFIIIETIRGKAMSEIIATRLTIGGFSLLLLLILIVSYHDIVRLLHI